MKIPRASRPSRKATVRRSGSGIGCRRSPGQARFTIESGRRWAGLDLPDLWAHRDLFFFLVMRDVKVRYKQTALGVAWAVLQPLLTMVVFTAIFGRLAGVPVGRSALSDFRLRGVAAVEFFQPGGDEQQQQSGRQRRAHH